MGFFYNQSAADARQPKRGPAVIPIELMQKQGCNACSLDARDGKRVSPKMQPTGSRGPDVYVLTGFPNEDIDRDGLMTDEAGQLVLDCIPTSYRKTVRYNQVVKCYSTDDKTPSAREFACCSGLTLTDIEKTEPKVVLGVGQAPLQWALGSASSDQLWRGRLWPIKVGRHVCWYYQIQDPAFVLKMQEDRRYDTEWMIALRFDIKHLFSIIDDLEPPRWIDEDARKSRIVLNDGKHELAYEALCNDLDEMKEDGVVGIDIETNCLRPYTDGSMILTVAISSHRKTLAFPVEHPEGWKSAGERRAAKELLIDFILHSGLKVAHHLGFEQEWFAYHFGELCLRLTEWGDSYASGHTLDERVPQQRGKGALGLGVRTQQRFGFNVKEMSNIDVTRILEYPLSDVLLYNALDAKWGRELFLADMVEIEAEPALLNEYERKVRLCPTLVLAQLRGLTADVEYAREQQEILEKEISAAARLCSKDLSVIKFEADKKRAFSMSSDDDVATLLRDYMKRKEGERPGGKYSADEKVLSSIPAEAGLAPQAILSHRTATKLKGTYIDRVLGPANDKPCLVFSDGKIHTVYNSMIAETGRLSSEDPNAQNYPKRKRKEIRGYIVCIDGRYYLVAFDYGQIEARGIAMASEDKALVDAMWTGYDIHTFWAERMVDLYPDIKGQIAEEFEVDWDEKGMKLLRQESKNKWVFPMFFGSSHKSCARNLKMPDNITSMLEAELWDQFPGVKKWQKRLVSNWEKNLYVETLGGRRRRGPLSLNQIINTPVQGTAADIVTDAMERLSVIAQVEEKPQFQPPLNVHDDLTFDIPRASIVEDVERIAYEMCNCRFSYINVPLLVEVSVSKKRWHELEEVGVYRSDDLGIHTR